VYPACPEQLVFRRGQLGPGRPAHLPAPAERRVLPERPPLAVRRQAMHSVEDRAVPYVRTQPAQTTRPARRSRRDGEMGGDHGSRQALLAYRNDSKTDKQGEVRIFPFPACLAISSAVPASFLR